MATWTMCFDSRLVQKVMCASSGARARWTIALSAGLIVRATALYVHSQPLCSICSVTWRARVGHVGAGLDWVCMGVCSNCWAACGRSQPWV